VENDLLRNLDVLNKTLSLIRLHSRGIKLNLEGVGGSTNDLNGVFQFVNTIQTFNFSKFDIVTFLVTVSLILMHSNNSGVGARDVSNNEGFALLTISIINHKLITIIKEGVADGTKGLRCDETNSIVSAKFVDCNHVIHTTIEAISVNNNIVLEMLLHGKLSEEVDLDVWVELSKLTNTGFSSGNLTNMLLLEIEIAREILNSSHSRVEDIKSTRSSQDKVLSSLNTETSHTNDEDSHLDELAHSLHTEGTNLSGVKVSIDFYFLV